MLPVFTIKKNRNPRIGVFGVFGKTTTIEDCQNAKTPKIIIIAE
jgi:hypothetical protein